MKNIRNLNKTFLIIILCFFAFTSACNKRETTLDPNRPLTAEEKRKKNIAEGRGASIGSVLGRVGKTTYEFSTSNPLWRASLETLDFLPLSTVDYSGGIIITDWYSENPNESIKVTIRFLSNEVRSDAISIKIFYRKCKDLINCNISENKGNLGKEIKKEILKKAAIYKKQTEDKNFKPYTGTSLK